MDFSTYTSNTKLGAPADQTSNVRISNPGADALAREQAKTGAIVMGGIDRLRAEVQTGRVMQANNEYNKELMDLTNELRQNKEQDALNTVEQFDEREQKIRSRIQKKYGSYLYGDVGRKYSEMQQRDYNTRRQSMINYQIGEAEKFNDTQYANQLLATQQEILLTGDDASIDAALTRGAYLAGNRFAHYGQERIQMEAQKMASTMVGAALSKALAEDDYGRVDEIRNKYARFLNPEQSINMMKLSNKFSKDNMELQLFKEAYTACGNNPYALEKYIEDYCAKTGGNAEAIHECFRKTKGQPYQLGAAEDGVNGNWDCGAWTKWVAKHCGLGGIITNRCADAQFKQFEEAGRAFGPDQESKLRDGDFVFWTGTGGEEGYKGIAHVGIYNGKTGRVMQSGTHGVAECDLHQYKIVGFGRGAGGIGRSPAEVEKLKERAHQFVSAQEGRRRSYTNELVHEGELKMTDLMLRDETNPGAYQSIISEYAVNDETRIRLTAKYAAIQKGIAKSAAGSSSGSGGKSNPLSVYDLGLRLQHGENPDALRLEVMSGDNKPEEKVKMMKMIDGLNETLTKEYELTAMASDMTAGYSGTDKNTYKKVLAEYTAGRIAEFIGTNNTKPTYKQVQEMMRYGMTAQKTGFLGDKVPSPAVLYMQTGVEDYKRNMRDDVPDGYNVRYKGSWYHISDRQILAIKDGQMTLDEAIREGYK